MVGVRPGRPKARPNPEVTREPVSDQFEPVKWAEPLEDGVDSCEPVGLEANHPVPEGRTEAFAGHLTDFLT